MLNRLCLLLIGSVLLFQTMVASAAQISWANASFINRDSAEVGVADFDKDGHVDIAIASSEQRWYAGPDFDTHYVLGRSDGGPYAAQVADINDDGWPDFITSDGERTGSSTGELYVYLNPGDNGDTKLEADWTRITVYSGDVYHQNDLRIADMDGDGRLDIIERTWASERVVVALQNQDINSWTVRIFDTGETGKPEGISAGDIDGDDEMEIVLSGVYWDNPGGWRSGDPVEYLIDSQFQGSTFGKVKSAVGDIDNDGDNDIYMGSAEGSDRYLAWYENQGVGSGGGVTLVRHIIKDNFGKCHMVQLVDIDQDGDLDLATGRSFGQKGLLVFYNEYTPQAGVSWSEQNYDVGGEIYTGVVADLDNDFDLDVVGPSTFYRNKVRIYKNLTPVNPPEPLELSPSQFSFTAPANSAVLNIETNEEWQLSSNQTWLTASVNSGSGDANVTLFAAANEGFVNRVARVTVDNGTNQQVVLVTQAGLPDSTAPSVPANVVISEVNFNSFKVTWNAASDNSGVIQEYIVFVNSAEQRRMSQTSVIVGGLTQQTSYSVQVSAVDPSRNESAKSNAVTAITTQRPPSPLPVFHWKLNESSGLKALESIANEDNNLLGLNGDEWIAGKLGNALSFNTQSDEDDRIELGNIDAPSSALTIAAWIRPNDFAESPEGRVIAKATGIQENQHYWMLSTIELDDGIFVPRVRLRTNGSVTTLVGTELGSISEGQWSHIAASYDGNTLSLFLNGLNVASTAKSGTVDQNSSVSATIGNIPAGNRAGRAFRGDIDDVCIFDQALSPTDLASIYNNGNGAPCDNFGEGSVDITAPVIAEGVAVQGPTSDTTPNFTLVSNEAGSAAYSGDCSATPSQVVSAGNTVVTLSELPFGDITDCRVVVTDAAGNASLPLLLTAFNIIEPDTARPSVTVNQAPDQADPTSSNIARFIAEFSEPINRQTFSAQDIVLMGTLGQVTLGPLELAPNNGTRFTFSVTEMSLDDLVIAALAENTVADAAGNLNTASSSSDNQVSYVCNLCEIDDQDGDGIEDSQDNCPSQNNSNQLDIDGNGIGDLCEELCVPIKARNGAIAMICL